MRSQKAKKKTKTDKVGHLIFVPAVQYDSTDLMFLVNTL